MEFDMPNGPWKPVMNSEIEGNILHVFRNPDKAMAFAVEDKSGDGYLIMLKNVLLVEGDLIKLANAPKRDLTLIEKFSRDGTFKYVIFGPEPEYVKKDEKLLSKAVRHQAQELDGLTQVVKEFFSSIGMKTAPLSQATEEQVANIFYDPMNAFYATRVVSRVPEVGRAVLGWGKNSTKIELDKDSLQTVMVVGEQETARLHALHVLAEAALLLDTPVIVIDSHGVFLGLGSQGSERELMEYNLKPVAFPFKSHEVGKGFSMDLSKIPSDLFLHALGVKGEAAAAIKKAFNGKNASIRDLMEELALTKDSKELSQYQLAKAIRLLSTIEKSFPNAFGQSLDPEFFTPHLGKVFHLNLSSQSAEIADLVIHFVLSALSTKESMGVFVVIDKDFRELDAEARELIMKTKKVGFALQTSDKVAFDDATRIELIGSEAILVQKNDKPKRFAIRPAFSRCTEKL